VGDLRRVMAPGWERELADPLLAADIARATDVDPARRFAAVADFAEHIRALPDRRTAQAADEAARAEAAAARDALARARQRRPWWMALLAALALGLGVALWLADGQRRARAEADQRLKLVQALNGVLADDLIGAANPVLAGRADVTVAQAMAAAASGVGQRFAQAPPDMRAGLHLALQRAYSQLGQYPQALAQGRLAEAAFTQAGQGTGDAAAESRLTLAADLVQTGRLDEARRAVAAIDDATTARMTPLSQARLLAARAALARGVLALGESQALLQQARTLLAGRPGPPSAEAALLAEDIQFDLAQLRAMLGEHDEAAADFRTLLAQQESRHGPGHPQPLYTRAGMGGNLAQAGDYDAAEALLAPAAEGLARTLGPDHRKALTARDLLAGVYYRRGDYARAATQWAGLQGSYQRVLGRTSPRAVTTEQNIGLAWLLAGDALRAEAQLRSALQHARATLADDAPRVQNLRFSLADSLLEQGGPAVLAEVPSLLAGLRAEALNLAQQQLDWPARMALLRGRLLLAQGQRDAARAALAEAAAGLDPETRSLRFNRATAERLLARAGAAGHGGGDP
jgi:non-specific serine/threonine protein kinase